MNKCFIFLVVFVCSFSTHTMAKCIYRQGLNQSDIVCDEENDTVIGDFKDNLISGSIGNDTLDGYSGNDVIDGGMGNDTLTGGSGNDTFFFDIYGDNITPEPIDDTIKDFGNGTDKIELNTYYQNGLVLSNQKTDSNGKYYILSNESKKFSVKIYSNNLTFNSLGIKYHNYDIRAIPQNLRTQYQLNELIGKDAATDKTYTQYALTKHGIPLFATNNVTTSQIAAHIREINYFFDKIYYNSKDDLLNFLKNRKLVIFLRYGSYGTVITINNNQNIAVRSVRSSNATGYITIHEIGHALSRIPLRNLSDEFVQEHKDVFLSEGSKFLNTTDTYAAKNVQEFWAEIVRYALGHRNFAYFIKTKDGKKQTLKEFSPISYELVKKYIHGLP